MINTTKSNIVSAFHFSVLGARCCLVSDIICESFFGSWSVLFTFDHVVDRFKLLIMMELIRDAVCQIALLLAMRSKYDEITLSRFK